MIGKIRKSKCGSCLPAKMRHHLTYHHECTSQCIACNSSVSRGAQESFCLICFACLLLAACFKRRCHGRQQELDRKYVAQELTDYICVCMLTSINSDQTSEIVNSVVQVSCQVWLVCFGGRAAPGSRPCGSPENGTCQTDASVLVSLTLGI